MHNTTEREIYCASLYMFIVIKHYKSIQLQLQWFIYAPTHAARTHISSKIPIKMFVWSAQIHSTYTASTGWQSLPIVLEWKEGPESEVVEGSFSIVPMMPRGVVHVRVCVLNMTCGHCMNTHPKQHKTRHLILQQYKLNIVHANLTRTRWITGKRTNIYIYLYR